MPHRPPCLLVADDGHCESTRRYAGELASVLGVPLLVAHVAGHQPRTATNELRRVAAGLRPVAIVLAPGAHPGLLAAALRDTSCPVLSVPVDGLVRPPVLRRVGLAFDGSPGSRAAREVAERLVRRAGAELVVLEVPPGARPGPVTRLRREAETLDLLVCGSHGRLRRSFETLGAVAARLADHPVCPVLVVPPVPAAASTEGLRRLRGPRRTLIGPAAG